MSNWLLNTGRELGEGLFHLLLPACCHVCSVPLTPPHTHLCDACRASVFTDPSPCCPRCAVTIGPFAAPGDRCTLCRNVSFAFERIVRLGPYQGRLQEVVLRLKHRSNEGLAELIGEWWAESAKPRFDALAVDCVVPVPLYWKR